VLPFFISPVPNLLKPELTWPPLLLAETLPSWLTGINFVLLAVVVAVTDHCTIVLLPAIGFCLLVKLVAFLMLAEFGFFLVSRPKTKAQTDSASTAVCCCIALTTK